MDLEQICMKACEITKDTGLFIFNERKKFDRSAVEMKGKNDLVSYVDRAAESQLVEKLKKIIPDAGFITEEKTSFISGKEFTWIIDPLDGTTNFVHGVPCYSVSIGLTQNEKNLLIGIIYEPNLNECFYAWKGGGSFLNGKKIMAATTSRMEDALLATGFPYSNYSRMKEYMEVFDHCMRNTHGLRRWGSAAIDLAYVACGRFEGFYEYGLNAWDVAAGALIVLEAGGAVSDFSGSDNYLFGKEIIACGSNMHMELLNLIKNKFSHSSML